MLFEQRFWPLLADGSVTVTFRRWKRRQAVAGRRYRTPAGLLEVDAVDVVTLGEITRAEARSAGYPSVDALVGDLRGEPDSPLYRVRFHHVDEPDPRDTLAATATLTDDDLEAIATRLARLDASSTRGPWTAGVLDAIAARPGTRAADLAAVFGCELAVFKADVRKLKNLGLTQSLEVGYRISPRGAAYLGARRGG